MLGLQLIHVNKRGPGITRLCETVPLLVSVMSDLPCACHINTESHVNNEIIKRGLEAQAGWRECITACECPIRRDIDGYIAEILSHQGLLPIEEIVTIITGCIPADDIKLCRTYIFESARGRVLRIPGEWNPSTERDTMPQVTKRDDGACHLCMRCCRIWSWCPVPCEKHGPRDSVDKNWGRRPRFLS